MEHIISFGETFDDQDRPFYIEMAGITYPDPTYHITRKNSYIHCFEYVIRGGGIVTVDGITNYPSEGDLYVLPKGADHDYRSMPEDPFEKIWLNISGTLCNELIHVYGITGTLIDHKNARQHNARFGSQFKRCCFQAYGITPYDYILTRKIETAKLLLKNSSLTVKEIAYRLNFADEHYFSNIFLQKTGVRPKKY